jgi:hypothetical protein
MTMKENSTTISTLCSDSRWPNSSGRVSRCAIERTAAPPADRETIPKPQFRMDGESTLLESSRSIERLISAGQRFRRRIRTAPEGV